MSTHLEPPTDPQLAMIARMCDEHEARARETVTYGEWDESVPF